MPEDDDLGPREHCSGCDCILTQYEVGMCRSCAGTTVSDVPRAKIEELARLVRELLQLRDHQAQVQAKLVRWCVKAIRNKDAPLGGHVTGRPHMEARKRQKEDAEKALLYLEWLATKLENQVSGNLTEADDVA